MKPDPERPVIKPDPDQQVMKRLAREEPDIKRSLSKRSKVRPLLALTALPDHALGRIVEYVHQQSALESKSASKQKSTDMEMFGGYVPVRDADKLPNRCVEYKQYWCFRSPILTTLQSLGAVNKQFHELCRPWLWRNVRFPTTMPAPMSLWTDNILLKHGNLVESITITLADEQRPDNALFRPDADLSVYDNLMLRHGPPGGKSTISRRGISLQSAEELLMACPGTTSVTICFPPSHRTETGSTFYDSICKGFAAAISRTPLRHCLISLRLADPMCKLSGRFVTDIIRELPSLVSLNCVGFNFTATDVIEDSLWWNLTQLEHLRELRLSSVRCQDETWNKSSWLDRLHTLTIYDCVELSPAKLHELLSGSASQLTRLEFEGQTSNYDSHPTQAFNLPALTQLILRHEFRDFSIASFQECKDLKQLKYCCMVRKECGVLRELITLNTWPSLKLLDLRQPKKGWRVRDPGFEYAERRLADVCKTANIEVALGRVDDEGK